MIGQSSFCRGSTDLKVCESLLHILVIQMFVHITLKVLRLQYLL